MLKIYYFASVREAAGSSDESLAMPNHIRNVRDLVAYLINSHGENFKILNDESNLKVAVNQTVVNFDHPLQGDEEIAFFPPMTGG